MQPRKATAAPWWIGVPTAGLLDLGQDVTLPRWLSVLMLSLARMNLDGHAAFSVGELRTLLARPVGGELVPATPSSVSRAVADARERGLIQGDSTAQCVVVQARYRKAGSGRRGTLGCIHQWG